MTKDELVANLNWGNDKIDKNKTIITPEFLARLEAVKDRLQTLNPSAVVDMAKFIGFDIIASDVQTTIDGIDLFIETEREILDGKGDQAQTIIKKILASPLEEAIIARFF